MFITIFVSRLSKYSSVSYIPGKVALSELILHANGVRKLHFHGNEEGYFFNSSLTSIPFLFLILIILKFKNIPRNIKS